MAANKYYLSVKEKKVKERGNRIIKICMCLVDKGNAKRA